METNVVKFGLTEHQLKLEYKKIIENYPVIGRFVAERDRAVSMLFARSGMTCEEVAKLFKLQKSQVSRKLILGRFLLHIKKVSEFPPQGGNFIIPSNLNERRFREYWSMTDSTKVEPARFDEIIELMKPDIVIHPEYTEIQSQKSNLPRNAKNQIVDNFGDKKWHSLEKIARLFPDASESEVRKTLSEMKSKNYRNSLYETKILKDQVKYRIQQDAGRKMPVLQVLNTIQPFLDELSEEGEKNLVRFNPHRIIQIADVIEKTLKDLAKNGPK